MKNLDIRQAANEAGLKLWQVAELIGVSPTTFSIRLRHEITGAEKKRILDAIKRGRENV